MSDALEKIMAETKRSIEVVNLAYELMGKHGLTAAGWRFKISDTKGFLGRCNYTNKVIEYSRYYLHAEIPTEEIRDTILHEIAHALAGSSHGHDHYWQAICIQIGAKPERLAPSGIKTGAKHNYVIKCSACDNIIGYKFRLRSSFMQRYRSHCCNAQLLAHRIVH